MSDFLVVFDIPGIKQFVFGTDPLKEIRGASTQLVEMNAQLTEWLRECFPGEPEKIECVYSNGGAAQFCLRDVDDQSTVVLACTKTCCKAHQFTCGQARLAFGYAPFTNKDDYKRVLKQAHWRMRLVRETAFGHSATSTWPLAHECSTASHLPAQCRSKDDPAVFLSQSSYSKQQASFAKGRWDDWLETLPDLRQLEPDTRRNLRCEDFDELASYGSKSNYLAVVYADGNAMGKLVFELDSIETCREFSRIVDDSICEACYHALTIVCKKDIDGVVRFEKERQQGTSDNKRNPRLPSDILLLGGDDLCVALPADRALLFAELVCDKFRELTSHRIAKTSGVVGDFFAKRAVSALTISCGIAIAHVSYPFPLLLELAEELLKNAKRAGSEDTNGGQYRSPAYVDFHVVTSSSSHSLNHVRAQQYFTNDNGNQPRTMRPMRLDRLIRFREALLPLTDGNGRIPRSKLHALFDGAMRRQYESAKRDVRTVFARCSLDQRLALWKALEKVADSASLDSFPQIRVAGNDVLPIPDFVDAIDLY